MNGFPSYTHTHTHTHTPLYSFNSLFLHISLIPIFQYVWPSNYSLIRNHRWPDWLISFFPYLSPFFFPTVWKRLCEQRLVESGIKMVRPWRLTRWPKPRVRGSPWGIIVHLKLDTLHRFSPCWHAILVKSVNLSFLISSTRRKQIWINRTNMRIKLKGMQASTL